MKRTLVLQILLAAAVQTALAIQSPVGIVSRTGDQSVVLHWDRNSEANLSGYRVYRSSTGGGPFTLLNASLLSAPGYCDLSVNVVNAQTNFYRVTAVNPRGQSDFRLVWFFRRARPLPMLIPIPVRPGLRVNISA